MVEEGYIYNKLSNYKNQFPTNQLISGDCSQTQNRKEGGISHCIIKHHFEFSNFWPEFVSAHDSIYFRSTSFDWISYTGCREKHTRYFPRLSDEHVNPGYSEAGLNRSFCPISTRHVIVTNTNNQRCVSTFLPGL